ncbi:MAG: hypothetical protein AB1483_06515 [Candidatus Zixiibacteriota bacterium]
MMKLVRIVCTFVALVLVALGSRAYADVSAALSIEDGRIADFYLAVGSHYNVPEKDLVVVKKRQISDDDLVVVFYLARQARVSPTVVVDLRLSGKTWMEITRHFGLTAEIFYVSFEKDPGPPYGKAYGHFRHRHRNEWGSISLSDVDVVNFVNLRFVSDYHGLRADEVAKMRAEGQSFIAINDKIKKSKAQKKSDESRKAETKSSKDKGKK